MQQEVVLIGGSNDGRRVMIGHNAITLGQLSVVVRGEYGIETYHSRKMKTVIGSCTIWCYKDLRNDQLLPTLLKGYSHEKEVN